MGKKPKTIPQKIDMEVCAQPVHNLVTRCSVETLFHCVQSEVILPIFLYRFGLQGFLVKSGGEDGKKAKKTRYFTLGDGMIAYFDAKTKDKVAANLCSLTRFFLWTRCTKLLPCGICCRLFSKIAKDGSQLTATPE